MRIEKKKWNNDEYKRLIEWMNKYKWWLTCNNDELIMNKYDD